MIAYIIPGHITALYIFAVINLMALFHITLVEANIVVFDDQNRTRDELLDLPSKFGPPFPEDGTKGRIVLAIPPDGCQELQPAPPTNGTGVKWIALIQRRNCDFDVKVLNAQEAGYVAALVSNIGSDELLPMGPGQEGDKVKIPSAFIGEEDAYQLKAYSRKKGWSVLIDNRVPFNANLYLLPFAIVVGICFILMLIFMIAKWVRDLRKRRRARLSREHLKKLPTKKFKKGDPYDMCAICLDEYEEGDKLRILPCSHAYHMKCVDPWLTKNKRTCPVCKRKVIPGDEDDSDSEIDSEDENEAPSETTPLLTAQAAGQLGANNSAFNNSGGVSDARSAHHEDLETSSDLDDVPTPSTSVSTAEVHAPLAMAQPGNRRQGGYGSLSINTNTREGVEEEGNHGNLETLEGAQRNTSEDEASEAEMRGVISSDGDEADEDMNTSLRVKIISLFKNRKRNRRQRGNSTEDA